MTKTVASIHFEERRLVRPLYGGNFYAPAVPKGDKPFLLTVNDHYQPEKQPYIVGGRVFRNIIIGDEIAVDIIQHWTAGTLGMTGDVHPGIWVVRDVITLTEKDANGNDTGIAIKDAYGVVQSRPATEEEKATMWAQDLAENIAAQARWGEFNIQQADAYAKDENSKMRLLIGPTMKAAAKYYGRDREWLEELKDGDTKTCPFCVKSIDRRVIKCPHCSEIVDRAAYDKINVKSPLAPPLSPADKKQQVA